jgi:hypothetical protein
MFLTFLQSLFGVKDSNSGNKPMTTTRKKSKPATTKPAPATPINQVAVLEADEESTDLLPQGLIRSEVNLLSFPFFALSRKDAQKRMMTEYRTTLKRGEERLDVSWLVSANPRYGYPRPFDRQVHRAIEQIISEMKPPIQNPIPIGSLYRIAQLLNLQRSGRLYNNIKAAIQRIVTTSIESKGTYYDKGRRRWREATFHLYDKVVFTGEELYNGEVADDNYLVLDSWYLDNINSRYVRPLDYTYYRTLHSPIASRLYELLGVKFYGMGKYPYIRYRYSNLCKLLPLTQYQRVSKAKEILNPAHDELIRTGFFANVEWDTIQGEKHDWYVSYYPGTRAKEEIQRFRTQVALPPPDDSVEATPQPTPATPIHQVTDDVVSALQNFGITKNQAQKLAKAYPQAYILEKLQMVKFLAESQDPLVSKNPQGFLVKALEDDYKPPARYQRKAQQDKEAEERQQREEREQQERVAAREQAREQLQQEHPPQPIAGTEHTTETVWAKTLEALQQQVPQGTYLTWLKDTLLLRLEENTAFVMVESHLAREYLERRLFGLIARALKQVLGYPVDVEFVVAEPQPEVS